MAKEIWEDLTPLGKCTIGIPMILLAYFAMFVLLGIFFTAERLMRAAVEMFPALGMEINLARLFFKAGSPWDNGGSR